MTIPNVGVSGVIQQPGIGNVLGQSVGGIAQMLMQIEQAKQEAAKNAAYNAYMQELQQASVAKRQSDAAEAAALAKRNEQMGGAVRDYLTPQQVQSQINVPLMVGGGPSGTLSSQVTTERERSLQDILKTLPPELVPDFVNTVAPVEKSREEKKAGQVAQRAMRSYLQTLPPQMRPMMEAIVRLEEGGVPANLSQFVVAQQAKEIGKDPKAIAALRKKYPELANLPDEQVVERAALLATEEAKRRLGLGQRVGGGGTRTTPAGRTPAEVKAELSALGPQVTTARLLANQASGLPRLLSTGPTGRPRALTTQDSVGVAAAREDSAAAVNDLQTLIGQQRQLFQELQQVQGAPGVGVTVAPPSPTETISLDEATGRRIATDSVTGQRRYLDPPR